jgi:hypothetical protein
MPSAPLQPLSLVVMGAKGLNLQSASSLLEPTWATSATNMVFDKSGRLSSRNGWVLQNATPMSGSPTVGQIFEYTPITGSNQVVSTGGNKIYSGTTTLTDRTGALTPSADNWKFQNFNGNVYGLQSGHPLIVWNGSGNFAAVTAASGSVPNGNELLSAFGRLWGVDSTGQTIKYCNLLDATNWNITGAGSINVTSVWGTGNDSIVALASFNSLLVIFGSRNIIVYQDGSGSPLGLDPIHIQVSDMISGIGCIARDSIQNINGDDLVFLSSSGVQSLKRVILERSNAIRNISLNVRDYLMATVGGETPAGIRSTYNAFNGTYLLHGPQSGLTFCFDTKITLEDGTWRTTTWNSFVPTALYTLHDSSTTLSGKAGQLFQYLGQNDNGAAFTANYESGWLDLDPQIRSRIKLLKRLECVFANTGGGTLTLKWAYDFNDNFYITQKTIDAGSTAEWGTAEWGLDEWGGGQTTYNIESPGTSGGQFIKVGASIVILDSNFALQQLQLFAKAGRLI